MDNFNSFFKKLRGIDEEPKLVMVMPETEQIVDAAPEVEENPYADLLAALGDIKGLLEQLVTPVPKAKLTETFGYSGLEADISEIKDLLQQILITDNRATRHGH